MCKFEEARKRSNQKVMLSEAWRDTFGNGFAELRKAIFNRDSEAIAESIESLESAACDLVEQVEDTRTGV